MARAAGPGRSSGGARAGFVRGDAGRRAEPDGPRGGGRQGRPVLPTGSTPGPSGRPGPRAEAPTEPDPRRRATPGVRLRSPSCGPVRPRGSTDDAGAERSQSPAPNEANPRRRPKPIAPSGPPRCAPVRDGLGCPTPRRAHRIVKEHSIIIANRRRFVLRIRGWARRRRESVRHGGSPPPAQLLKSIGPWGSARDSTTRAPSYIIAMIGRRLAGAWAGRAGPGDPSTPGLIPDRRPAPPERPSRNEGLRPVTAILGLSAFYHDSAATLVVDGEVVAAAQEERFTRKKHDPDFPAAGRRLLPGRGGVERRRPRLRGLLRQAAGEVRAAPGDVPRVRPRGLPQLPDGDAALAQGQAPHAPDDPPRPRRRPPGPARLHRAPREPRRQCLLPEPVRRGRHPQPRRRRRVGHRRDRHRPGEPDRAVPPDQLPPLAGPALLGLHLLLRLQGQQRRIQAHGPRPLRPAHLPGRDPGTPRRPQARRQLPARHGLFQLLPGPDDDESSVPRSLRRPAARARIRPDPAAHGPRREHPGRHRGRDAPDRPGFARPDGDEEPRPGRRRRPELRGQRPIAPRGPVRVDLDPAGRGRRGRGAGRGAVRLAPAHGTAPPGQSARLPEGELPRAGVRAGRDPSVLNRGRPGGASVRGRGGALRPRGRAAGRREGRRLVPGPDGVRPEGAWAPGASSATRARPGCRRR